MNMSMTPSLLCIELHEFHHKTVAAGKTEIIVDYRVSGNFVGFIERIACDLPYEEETTGAIAKMFHEFKVDGAPEKIEYEIPISNPRVFDPPKVATKRILWRFYNADSKAHVIGVLVEGQLCKPKI